MLNIKNRLLIMTICALTFVIYMQTDTFCSEDMYLSDCFDTLDTQRWETVNSGDGKVCLEEYENRKVVALRKGNKTVGSAPAIRLRNNIQAEYIATSVVKIEKSQENIPIKSFEYVYFNLTSGTNSYRLQWFYNSSRLQLQKNGIPVCEKEYTKLPGYQKYGWNQYRFEVTKKWIKIIVNESEVMYYEDSGLNTTTFKFGISGSTMWPKNVGVYIDSVRISAVPRDAIMIDPQYSVDKTSDGRIKIKGHFYTAESNAFDKAVLIGAMYANDTLKGVGTAEVLMPNGSHRGEYTLLFNIGEAFCSLKVKLMLWKSYETAMPIAKAFTGESGYFVENLERIPETEEICSLDFNDVIEQYEIIPGSCEAGGYRIEKFQGKNVLKIFSGYAQSGTKRSFGIFLPEVCDSYVADVTIRSRRFLSESASIVFGYDSPENFYSLTWTQEGFPNIWEKRPAQKLRLCRNNSTDLLMEGFEEIMDDEAPFITQTYRLFVFGNKILVYRKTDGMPVFNFTSEQPITPGKIGFCVSGAGSGNMQLYVEDVKVWKFSVAG